MRRGNGGRSRAGNCSVQQAQNIPSVGEGFGKQFSVRFDRLRGNGADTQEEPTNRRVESLSWKAMGHQISWCERGRRSGGASGGAI